MLIDLIKDLVQIGFQLTIATVTFRGWWKWQVELTGKVEYDAAKQALANAYTIRDQIALTQSAIVVPSEWVGHTPTGDESKAQPGIPELSFAYSKRLSKLQDRVFNMYPVMVAAEAVFGTEGREKLEKLVVITNRLRGAIEAYHRNLYDFGNDPKLVQLNKRHLNIMNGINNVDFLSSDSEEESTDDDNFQRNLDAAMQEIQEYFVPKLGRKPPAI